MMHRRDKSAIYVGLVRVDGRIGTRSGVFVLRCQGTYEEGIATCSWSVVSTSVSSTPYRFDRWLIRKSWMPI